jgi:hypothetical protein
MVVTMTLQINTFNKSLRLHQEREPLETPIDRVEKVKHENDYHSWTETRIIPREV